MANLQNILYKVHLTEVHGSTNLDVSDIQIDSRKISKGALFVAIRGEHSDGHSFIDKAIELGAVAIVCEKFPAQFREGITYLKVGQFQ